jgi:integrase/recombinase XerD
MKLSLAIQGFLIHKSAEGKSPYTLAEYRRQLTLFADHLNNPDTADLDTNALASHLDWLRNEYRPTRKNRDTSPLAPKTLRNHWITLRSFTTWAMVELQLPDILKPIRAPQYQLPEIDPLTKSEVQALLAVVDRTEPPRTGARRVFTQRRHSARRDRAIILLILDTGIRAGELTRLDIADADLAAGDITIHPHGSARKSHPRILAISPATRKALWRYLAQDRPDATQAQPLLLSRDGYRLQRGNIRFLISRLGKRAQIKKPVYPHRLRHTFAITYLRNGGDIYTLQRTLGHASLETVKRYLKIAQIDIKNAHQRASPVANWRL